MISSLYFSMISMRTRSALVARKNRLPPRIKSEDMLFRIML